MPKRANGEGTAITKRPNGTWWARYTDPSGKRVPVYGKTQGEVKEKLDLIKSQLTRGEYVTPDRVTVGEWVEQWFRDYMVGKCADSTLETHRHNIDTHILPDPLAKMRLQQVKPADVQAFIKRKENYISLRTKKPLASGTIHKLFEPLDGAFKQAWLNEQISLNPCDRVKLPKMQQKEVRPIPADARAALLANMPDTTHARAFRFMLATGLRASELCGLQWGDLDGDVLHIRRAAMYCHKIDPATGKKEKERTLSIKKTKTKKSAREIPLSETPGALAVLEEQRSAQKAERLKAGRAWQGASPGAASCHMFTTAMGTVIDRDNMDDDLRLWLKQAGFEGRGLHALRHTFATHQVDSGTPAPVVSDLLGHTKVAFTLQQYYSSDMEAKRKAMRNAQALIGK